MTIPELDSHLTIAQLCRRAPDALVPLSNGSSLDTPVSGVHISELLDPTPYLGGGELLLTTGLTLPRARASCLAYVSRLREASVAGLALGLGPVHAEAPPRLADACAEHDLPFLVVPELVPFQRVTRAFWGSVGEEQQRALYAVLDSHRRLVTAVASADPVSGVLRTLAETVHGWVALTDLRGHPVSVWPETRADSAQALVPEVLRLRPSGTHASSTFPLGGDVASLHPVTSGGAVVGYLATVAPRALLPHHRNVVLSSLALLGLDATHRGTGRSAERSERAAVAHLIDRGHLTAASALATVFAVEHPPASVLVVAAADDSGTAALDAVIQVLPEHANRWVGATSRRTAWVLLHPGVGTPDVAELDERLEGHGSSTAVVLGPVVALDEVHPVRRRLEALARNAPPGRARQWRPRDAVPLATPEWAEDVVAPLRDYRRSALVPAVAAYLRHRGHWEAAATDLGVHRNSLRGKVARAERLLGEDLRDPDTAARVWIALRCLGLDTTAPRAR